jgi:hypothetical protein
LPGFPLESRSTRAKMAARAELLKTSPMFPSLAVVSDFPSTYVETARKFESVRASLDNPAEAQGAEGWPQAVSQAQVFWARNQLRKARNGAPVPQSMEELEALANTPLVDLPERAGQKAPTKKAPTKKATKSKATPKAKAKEA